jgi:molybdopterin-binding protein
MSVAAGLLGVSPDTLRRWADAGRVPTTHDKAGRRAIDGVVLAQFAGEIAATSQRPIARSVVSESAKNRFLGLVTAVRRDTVTAEVEIQAGPHRLVSLMSRQEADELGLEPGVLAMAAMRSTSVVVHRSAGT